MTLPGNESEATDRQWSAQCSSQFPLRHNVACRTNELPPSGLMPKKDRTMPITLDSHNPLGKDLKSNHTCRYPSTCIGPKLGRGSAPSFNRFRSSLEPFTPIEGSPRKAMPSPPAKARSARRLPSSLRTTGQEPTGYIAQARAEAWAKAKARAKAAAAKPKAAAGTSSRSWPPPEPPTPARRHDYADDDQGWQDWSLSGKARPHQDGRDQATNPAQERYETDGGRSGVNRPKPR